MKKLQVNANMAWALLVIAAVIECFWASGLKYAQSPWVYALVVLGIAISFGLNLIACHVIEAAVVYAVFVGLGTAGIVITEIVIFGEPFSFVKVALIAILVGAVITLKTTSKSGSKKDSQIASIMSENLGIDEIIQTKGDSK